MDCYFQGGFCGIPPALVQRYSEELKKDVFEVAAIIDECRVKYLHAKSKPAVRFKSQPFFCSLCILLRSRVWGWDLWCSSQLVDRVLHT